MEAEVAYAEFGVNPTFQAIDIAGDYSVPEGYFIASAHLFLRHSDQVAAFCAEYDIS